MSNLMKYKKATVAQIDRYIDDPDWVMEQKLDGMRVRLIAEDGNVEIRGAASSTAVADEVAQIRDLGAALLDAGCEVDLDGEIVDGTWWLFDCARITVDSTVFTTWEMPWTHRRDALEHAADPIATALPADQRIDVRLVPVARTGEQKRDLWTAVNQLDLEGVILKHVNGEHNDSVRRTDEVLKVKITDTVDVVVMERGPGNGKNGTGNWLRFGVHIDGELTELGRCSIIGKPHADPGDVIEVKYLYAGAGGRLVQPTHLRNRPDRTPESCDDSQLRTVNKTVIGSLT